MVNRRPELLKHNRDKQLAIQEQKQLWEHSGFHLNFSNAAEQKPESNCTKNERKTANFTCITPFPG